MVKGVIATALENPYSSAVLARVMRDPIGIALNKEWGIPTELGPIEDWLDWPKGIVPLVGETWESYQNRIGDPTFDNISVLRLSQEKIEEKEDVQNED